jgi:hypothetical protein
MPSAFAVPLYMAEHIEIPESKSTKWVLFGISLLFTFAGLWLSRTEQLLGLLCAIFFGYMSSVWLRKVMDPRARVTLTHDGIEDRNNGFGLVAWSDIDLAYLNKIEGTEFISIRVHNEDDYLQRLSTFKRRTSKLNRALGHPPISISLVGLKIKGEELLTMIQKRSVR